MPLYLDLICAGCDAFGNITVDQTRIPHAGVLRHARLSGREELRLTGISIYLFGHRVGSVIYLEGCLLRSICIRSWRVSQP